MALPGRLRELPGLLDARLDPLRRTLPWRAYARYTGVRGNVLAGGVAYFAFFSLFPAMALGFTVFGLVLGGQEDLQVRLVQYVNENLGSAVITYRTGQGGVVSVEQLTGAGLLTTTGVLGFAALLLSGLGWVAALRDGVQAVFGAREDTNFVVLKLVDLLLLAAAGAAVLASVVLSVLVNVATDQVLDVFGIPPGELTGWAVNIAGQLVLVVVDALIFTLLFQRLAGVAVPLADVVPGGLAASVAFTVLKLFGSVLLRLAAHNRFLAAFGVVVGLLVWMNLVARVTLVAAALGASVAADRGHLPTPDLTPDLKRDPAADRAPQRTLRPAVGAAAAARPAGIAQDAAARRAAHTLLAAGFLTGAALTAALSRVGRSVSRRLR